MYKKYIKKNGKVFGPYYYETYRENGEIKTRYVRPKDKKAEAKKKDSVAEAYNKYASQLKTLSKPNTRSVSHDKTRNKTLFFLFVLLFALIALVVFVNLNSGNKTLTGKAITGLSFLCPPCSYYGYECGNYPGGSSCPPLSCGDCPAGTGACVNGKCKCPAGSTEHSDGYCYPDGGGDACGNGVCGTGENAANCPADCGGGCTPNCAGKTCGSDGCTGTCGTCASGQTCQNGVCVVCTPNCIGKCNGESNGCGGSCTCAAGKTCQNGTCVSGSFCGNGLCESGENIFSCPADCPVAGTCTPATCAELGYQCGSFTNGCGGELNCGVCQPGYGCQMGSCVWSDVWDCNNNGVCEAGENCFSCPNDCVCGAHAICKLSGANYDCLPGTCGDGVCDWPIEGCGNCAVDCGVCLSSCGNGICEPEKGETFFTCPADCGAGTCGDGICNNGENCATCPSDCVADPVTGVLCSSFIGNCICGDYLWEDCLSPDCVCPQGYICDGASKGNAKCRNSQGVSVPALNAPALNGCGGSICGDGVCNPGLGETPLTCPGDCGTCIPKCAGKECGNNGCGGNCGNCDAGETCQNGICMACVPFVTCGDWSACLNGQRARNCVDVRCGFASYIQTESCQQCSESWQCDWSACANGYSFAKNCIDKNNCGTNINKPSSKRCGLIHIPDEENQEYAELSPPPDCDPHVVCTEWSACTAIYNFSSIIQGNMKFQIKKKMFCKDNNNCLPPSEKEKSCGVMNLLVRQERICSTDVLMIYNTDTNETIGMIKPGAKLDIEFFFGAERPVCEAGNIITGKTTLLAEPINLQPGTGIFYYFNYTVIILIILIIIFIYLLIFFFKRRKKKDREVLEIEALLDEMEKASLNKAKLIYERVRIKYNALGYENKNLVRDKIIKAYRGMVRRISASTE